MFARWSHSKQRHPERSEGDMLRDMSPSLRRVTRHALPTLPFRLSVFPPFPSYRSALLRNASRPALSASHAHNTPKTYAVARGSTKNRVPSVTRNAVMGR